MSMTLADEVRCILFFRSPNVPATTEPGDRGCIYLKPGASPPGHHTSPRFAAGGNHVTHLCSGKVLIENCFVGRTSFVQQPRRHHHLLRNRYGACMLLLWKCSWIRAIFKCIREHTQIYVCNFFTYIFIYIYLFIYLIYVIYIYIYIILYFR